MIISHSHKFIFFEVGKTGTTSVDAVLEKYGFPFDLSEQERQLYDKHMPPVFLKEKLPADVWSSYFKFAFVRNPWDWVISRCAYNKEIGFDGRGKITKEQILKLYSLSSPRLKRGITWAESVFQWSRLSDREGNVLVDFIGRFERLQEDFDKVADRVGIPREPVPHLNRTQRGHYAEHYDEETRKLVYTLYKKDIECFRYTFDLPH